MVATIIPLIPRPKPGMSESHRFQEPVFDPNRHFALTPPSRIIRFTDPDIETGDEGGLVLTAPFRLLSTEGTAAAMEAAGHSTAFLTDLFRCREVAEFIGWLAGTSLIAMPSLAKNRENRQPGAATWHLGQRDFTCFLGLAAPDRSDTGCLDWFRGRSAVGAELLKSVGDISDQYKGSQPLPPAGFAVLARTGRLLHPHPGQCRRRRDSRLLPGDVRRSQPKRVCRLRRRSRPGHDRVDAAQGAAVPSQAGEPAERVGSERSGPGPPDPGPSPFCRACRCAGGGRGAVLGIRRVGHLL
jgi:hypothetical protein